MTADYRAWLEVVARGDDDDSGVRAAGVDRCLREVFDRRGLISAEELDAEAHRLAVDLARAAVELVKHDLHATTDARPVVNVRHDEEYGLIVAYNGGYSTPSMHSMQNPEATSEIADYLQGEIADDLWTVWPTCKSHGGGLDAKARDGEAVWHCRLGDHSVAAIGRLAP
ncbi:MAG: hypothetical protein M3Y44_16625 [Actinomycetota bacterium]|nr:hypothetical protein [Actinomycetota bacterium]